MYHLGLIFVEDGKKVYHLYNPAVKLVRTVSGTSPSTVVLYVFLHVDSTRVLFSLGEQYVNHGNEDN